MTYSGDISVEEAWRRLGDESSAVLVDVRTAAEWNFVGAPDLSGIRKQAVRVSWQTLPKMEQNPAFVEEVRAQATDTDASILFLCRSGARSQAAAVAMTAAGYSKCFNVAGGFEGDLDGDRHRGVTGGWKAAGLPWIQA
ncbi:MAG: rhodanese-like domain-containing protein [Proteobacteria bacterium]|nr:rhodanese-like domain-containing protein [Pseudomonadota bacterium]MCH8187462.1 rhodanese-like domain-containing protein [Pseudomonadota bacterium]